MPTHKPHFSTKDLAFLGIFGLWLLLALILVSTYFITSNIAEKRLQANVDFHLERLITSLDSTLDKHIYLPKVIAEHSDLKEFLSSAEKASLADVLKVNQYLSKVNELADTLDIYLMLPNGDTVASSNWDTSYSFVGKNFAFRPYFIQAMQNRLGRYFALGTTSQERGYYFASPVKQNNTILGILVVKIAIGEIEGTWDNPLIDFMVTDPHGVIFISSKKDWQLHSLKPLSGETSAMLRHSRQYGLQEIHPISLSVEETKSAYALVRDDRQYYLMVDKFINVAGWHIYVLMNRKETRSYILWSLAIVLLTSLLTAALLLLIVQRQRERRRNETQQREELENKVAERTHELKLTQEELIHAGKMAALGQLSASINHELNNPLAAIRAYADNAVQFLANDQPEITTKNLLKISQLTERMAAITHQLKSFSRKSQGIIEPISVHRALDSSLAILKPQITALKVQIDRVIEQENCSVLADQVWIEQILINLLKNAIDATEGVVERKLILRVLKNNKQMIVSISDNGEGLGVEQIEHIFEPFFTTKKSSKGLGLGLSISYRLAKDMQGTLTAANNLDGGGATFLLTLPEWTP